METAVFFGTLRVAEESVPTQLDIRYHKTLNFDMSRSEHLALVIANYQTKKICFQSSHINEKLLAAPMKSIGFVVGADSAGVDLTGADIVPKDIQIDVGAPIGFPTTFILSFLQRVAHLGHLEQLKLYFLDDHLIPCDVGKALLHAVAASEKLRYLELDSGAYAFDGFRKDLFAVLENHQGLRNFGISRYPVDLDPKHAWLKELLRRNRYIKVTGTRERLWILQDRDIKGLYAFNRFFRGSKSLRKEPAPIRQSLVGAAFTHKAVGNFQRAGLLLMDHVDMLCEILMEQGTEDGNLSPTAAMS